LSLYKFEDTKRNKVRNPKFVFICSLIIWMRCLITLMLKIENADIYIYIGDFPYFLKIRYQLYLLIMGCMSLSLVLQIINYKFYDKNKLPKYLKPFKMISGFISPKTVGLTEKTQIEKLMKYTKYLFAVTNFLSPNAYIAAFLLSFVYLAINYSVWQLITFGIPWSICFGFAGWFSYSIIMWPVIYFNIICNYLKMKQKNINNTIRLNSINKLVISEQVYGIINSLDLLHCEIRAYNKYWSIYLFWFCAIVSSLCSLGLFQFLFAEHIISKMIFSFVSGVLTFSVNFVLISASMVSLEAKLTYKLLIKFYLTHNFKLNIHTKFKV